MAQASWRMGYFLTLAGQYGKHPDLSQHEVRLLLNLLELNLHVHNLSSDTTCWRRRSLSLSKRFKKKMLQEKRKALNGGKKKIEQEQMDSTHGSSKRKGAIYRAKLVTAYQRTPKGL